jgi:hypothetical protein
MHLLTLPHHIAIAFGLLFLFTSAEITVDTDTMMRVQAGEIAKIILEPGEIAIVAFEIEQGSRRYIDPQRPKQ